MKRKVTSSSNKHVSKSPEIENKSHQSAQKKELDWKKLNAKEEAAKDNK